MSPKQRGLSPVQRMLAAERRMQKAAAERTESWRRLTCEECGAKVSMVKRMTALHDDGLWRCCECDPSGLTPAPVTSSQATNFSIVSKHGWVTGSTSTVAPAQVWWDFEFTRKALGA